MRNLFRYGFLAFALMLSIGVGASPGWADTSCKTGAICFWTSPNFTGSKRTLVLCCGWINLVSPYDNSISSWKDRSNKLYRGLDGYNGTGTVWIGLGNCSQDSSMTTLNNDLSSILMTTYPGNGDC